MRNATTAAFGATHAGIESAGGERVGDN